MSSVVSVVGGVDVDFYPRGAALRDLLRTVGTHLAVEGVNSPVLEPRLWWIPCRKWICETRVGRRPDLGFRCHTSFESVSHLLLPWRGAET